MAKPTKENSDKGGKGDGGGGGSKTINQAPVIADNQTLSFNEDGTTLQNQYVIASDPENGRLTFTLIDDLNGLFLIDSTTGEVTIGDSSQLNYESGITSFDLQVMVTDDAKRSLSTTSTIKVEVMDSNDHAPAFNVDQTTEFSVDENLSNVIIGTVSASDSDATTEHNTLTYSLSGEHASFFSIDDQGTIRLIKPLDFEVINTLELTVTASDGELSSDQVITVNVNDTIDSNLSPMTLTTSGEWIGAEGYQNDQFNQFNPYTIAVGDNDNSGHLTYQFDLTCSNIPDTVQLTSYVSGDAYSIDGATFQISFFDESAFSGFYAEGSITYQGLDSTGNDLFDISINTMGGLDYNAPTLYTGEGLNSDPWYHHDTGSFSESYWNPIDFGLSLNWTVSQYDGNQLIDSSEVLSTLNIIDTDSDLEDLLIFSDDEFLGAAKPDEPASAFHVSSGDIITLDYFDYDASVLILEDVLNIEPELDLTGNPPLIDLGNNQYQVVSDAGTYDFSVDMNLQGLSEHYDFQLIVDA